MKKHSQLSDNDSNLSNTSEKEGQESEKSINNYQSGTRHSKYSIVVRKTKSNFSGGKYTSKAGDISKSSQTTPSKRSKDWKSSTGYLFKRNSEKNSDNKSLKSNNSQIEIAEPKLSRNLTVTEEKSWDHSKTVPKASVELTTNHKLNDSVDIKQSDISIKPQEEVKETRKDINAKRDTVIKIPRPVDQKKQVFKKMMLLNLKSDNSLSRKPVYAWENAFRDIEEDKEIRMLCITWNLGENSEGAPDNIHELIKRDIQHDIYIIAVQNCANFTKWEKTIMTILGKSYSIISHESYRLLGLSFICRNKLKDSLNIESVCSDHYKDNLKTVKACAIGAKIAGKSYAFVNCYVNPNIKKPIDDKFCCPSIIEIDRSIDLYHNCIEEEKELLPSKPKSHSLAESYDVCIFLGGFNTPIVGSASGVNSLITSNLIESLKENDKMYLDFREYAQTLSLDSDPDLTDSFTYGTCRKNNENNLFGILHEGEIHFSPTYKIIPFTDTFDTTVLNNDDICRSGWTDRILWSQKQKQDLQLNTKEFFKQMSYDSNNVIKASHNRPVFSQFVISF